jgi:hypothetical protein
MQILVSGSEPLIEDSLNGIQTGYSVLERIFSHNGTYSRAVMNCNKTPPLKLNSNKGQEVLQL